MAKLLVKQAERGFLVDEGKIDTHLSTLEYLIKEIDDDVMPQLPRRMEINEQKKAGEYGWLKKPFKKNGDFCQYVETWIESSLCPEEAIEGQFSRVSWVEFNLGSGAQIKEYLLKEGWVPDAWNVSKLTGERTSPKLNADDKFLGVNSDIGKQVALRMQYRHRNSLLSGLKKLIRPDGRISAQVSGLCPTARSKHKGIVNIPGADSLFGKECREIFIAKPGYQIVGCDADQCQLRMLAHYMGDDTYKEAFTHGNKEDGTDCHSLTATMAGLGTRGEAKTLMYAYLFGAGEPKLCAQLGVAVTRVRKIKRKLGENLPTLKVLIDGLKEATKRRGYLVGLDGRKIFVRSAHMNLVYLLQSAEAILMKLATVLAHRAIKKERYDSHMVCMMHDEFQFETLETHTKDVSELLEWSIEEAGRKLELGLPTTGEAKIGNSWYMTH